MTTWQTTDPDEDWEAFKAEYWGQGGSYRPRHLPDQADPPDELVTTHCQFVGYLAKSSVKYNRYNDLTVTFTIPSQFASAAHRLFGLGPELLSVDVVAFPPLDEEVTLEEQLTERWWEK